MKIHASMAAVAIAALALFTSFALKPAAAEVAVKKLTVSIDHLATQHRFADQQAFCIPDGQGHSSSGSDVSPAIHWSKGPAGTKSYALILQDADVPVDFSTANQDGKVIAADVPRQTVTHWVLVDIPAGTTSLPAGIEGDRLTPKGKPQLATSHGRRGINDLGRFLASNPAMAGDYAGYDGPCPPWNDQRLHHYTLTVFALSVGQLPVSGKFSGPDMLTAVAPFILAKGDAMATYSLNSSVK